MNNKIKKVFEYSTLSLDDTFKEEHFKRLIHYNEKHGNKFFSVGNNRIYFKQYVGVIQIGDVIIEILPKADKSSVDDESSKNKWHDTLVDMLRECGFIKLENLTNANLKLRSASLIDLYFETFLNEVQSLIHHGLVKQYRLEESNLYKLKGRLIFSRNISENLIHKERFYTAHQVYDRNNVFNRILNKALNVLVSVTNNQGLIKSARNLQLSFEEVSDINVSENTFKNLRFSRITEAYRPAIQLARLIILNFSPDLKGGKENIMAILFDMNMLFEKFIYRRLKREEKNFPEYKLNIKGQTSREFWQGKSVRPDIILEYMIDDEQHRVIIDTKWKVLASKGPHDSDLRQMFVYNVHFKSFHGVLLYPEGEDMSQVDSAYEPSLMLENCEHSCRTYSANLFDNRGRIKKDLGKEIIMDLTSIYNVEAKAQL